MHIKVCNFCFMIINIQLFILIFNVFHLFYDYQRGISHYQNLQFFSICFMGMTQVQVLCKEEKMIISASYIFYYLKMCCWKSSVWYCQNKGLLWKEQNSCIFEDTNWSKTWLESLLIRTLVDWSRAWGA